MKFLFLILVPQAAVLELFLCFTVQAPKKRMWCCMKVLWPTDGKNFVVGKSRKCSSSWS